MTVDSTLFDADGTDEPVELDKSVVEGLTDRQLLWVDVHGPDEDQLRHVADALGLERQTIRNLLNPIGRPRLDVVGQYFVVDVVALADDDQPLELVLLTGRNWVATVHRESLGFLEELRERLAPDTELGLLTAPSFLAALL